MAKKKTEEELNEELLSHTTKIKNAFTNGLAFDSLEDETQDLICLGIAKMIMESKLKLYSIPTDLPTDELYPMKFLFQIAQACKDYFNINPSRLTEEFVDILCLLGDVETPPKKPTHKRDELASIIYKFEKHCSKKLIQLKKFMTIEEINEMVERKDSLTPEEKEKLAKAIVNNPEARETAIIGAVEKKEYGLAIQLDAIKGMDDEHFSEAIEKIEQEYDWSYSESEGLDVHRFDYNDGELSMWIYKTGSMDGKVPNKKVKQFVESLGFKKIELKA